MYYLTGIAYMADANFLLINFCLKLRDWQALRNIFNLPYRVGWRLELFYFGVTGIIYFWSVSIFMAAAPFHAEPFHAQLQSFTAFPQTMFHSCPTPGRSLHPFCFRFRFRFNLRLI